MATRWTSKHTGQKIDDTIDCVCNPNLLDNWYLGNPVNQRGQTEYNGISTIQYSIDRWLAHRSVVSLVDGGVKVGSAGTAISNLGFQTSIENPAYLVGKEVTMSVLLESNEATEIIYFGVFYGAGATNQTAWGIRSAAIPAGGVGLYSVTAVLPDMGTYKAMNPVIRVQGSQSGGFTIKAAKLELGSQQTLAHQDADGNWVLNEIPDYGEQLARCQRHQIPWESYERVRATLVNTSNLDFLIPTPVTMRTKPVINASVLKICKLDGTDVDGFSFAVKESVDPGFVSIRATKNSHGLTDALLYVSTRSIIDANL